MEFGPVISLILSLGFMDGRRWLKELAILIVVMREITIAESSDLLEQAFQPKVGDPPEVGDFLNSVLEHKDDFDFVKETAQRYQKMKKDTEYLQELEPFSHDLYHDFGDGYSVSKRRNARSSRGRHHKKHRRRKKKKKKKKKTKKKHRHRRHLPVEVFSNLEDEEEEPDRMSAKARREETEDSGDYAPSDIFSGGERIKRHMMEGVSVESEGEKGDVEVSGEKHPKMKKEAVRLESPAVHKTYKVNKAKKTKQERENQENRDIQYVELGHGEENNEEKRSEVRRYRGYPRQQYNHRMGLEQSDDYPIYEAEPLHHSLNDEVAFERAQSYEIEPMREELADYNNPEGNNLYSVDEGRPDRVELLNPEDAKVVTGDEQTKDVTNERFFMDNNNNLRKSDSAINAGTSDLTTTSTTSSTTSNAVTKDAQGNDVKLVKEVGQGFIEISRAQKNNPQEHYVDEKVPTDMLKESVQPLVKQEKCKSHDRARDLARKCETNKEKLTAKEEETPSVVSVDKKDVDANDDEDSLEKREKHASLLSKSSLEMDDKVDADGGEDELTNDDHRGSSILSKNSLHPLRLREAPAEKDMEVFQSRKLQFINQQMMNSENQDDDYEYIPKRPRRDFLDIIGMKNEDYSEDNPYKNIITDKNTDINNDTFYKNIEATTVKPTTHKCIQKQDMSTIKQILKEPKETGEQSTVGNFRQEKAGVVFKESNSDLGVYEKNVQDRQGRISRDISSGVATKILQNKERIYNNKQDNQNYNLNNDYYAPVKRGIQPQSWLNYRRKIKVNRDIKDPTDFDNTPLEKKDDIDSINVLNTTPLPLFNYTENNDAYINSSYEQLAFQMDMENEKLAQVVNGHLASKIVAKVYDDIMDKPSLKAKVYPGLSRKHVKYEGNMDTDIFKTNETEEIVEARLLLDQITKVLNKIVLNQVRRKLCQRLPDELKEYLEGTINIKKSLPTNSFQPNVQQGDFLFAYQPRLERGPFDMNKMQGVLSELQTLLANYNSMNAECQNRVEPVKDYIEKHVNVLKQIVSCPSHSCQANERKRQSEYDKNLVQRRSDRKRKFLSNFELDQLLKRKAKNAQWKHDKRDAQKKNNRQTDKFKKLRLAAQKVREKREYERKIAEMFGGKQKRSLKRLNFDYEEPVIYRF